MISVLCDTIREMPAYFKALLTNLMFSNSILMEMTYLQFGTPQQHASNINFSIKINDLIEPACASSISIAFNFQLGKQYCG